MRKAGEQTDRHVRHVRPNNQLLKSVDCWITGLRRDQSAHRQETVARAALQYLILR
jgi:3'-phosphoadenosine 5'-phosphosulfate sulfotransferase (PAPS reductase)/FAD synthetase